MVWDVELSVNAPWPNNRIKNKAMNNPIVFVEKANKIKALEKKHAL